MPHGLRDQHDKRNNRERFFQRFQKFSEWGFIFGLPTSS
jgi:hypothetical protein